MTLLLLMMVISVNSYSAANIHVNALPLVAWRAGAVSLLINTANKGLQTLERGRWKLVVVFLKLAVSHAGQ